MVERPGKLPTHRQIESGRLLFRGRIVLSTSKRFQETQKGSAVTAHDYGAHDAPTPG